MTTEIKTPCNSTYPKVAVKWLSQALCFHKSFCLVDSEVLRNRHLLQARNLNGELKTKVYDSVILFYL
jgi:hypothetical protein